MAENHAMQDSFGWAAGTSFGKLDVFMFIVVFLQSLLIAWFLFLLLQVSPMTALFRFMEGIAILFAVLVPVFIVLEWFEYSSITTGFFVPLALYTLMFPLFNSLVRHHDLFLDPAIIIPAIAGGIGFGLIGLGAYHFEYNIPRTVALVTAGITIIFLSSPAVLAGLLFVLTGNLPAFHSLLG